MQSIDFELRTVEYGLHQAQHVVVIQRQNLVLERNGAAIYVVGGNAIVAEHESQGPAATAAQICAENRIGYLAFLYRGSAQARQLSVLDQLSYRAAGINAGLVFGHQFPN